jgi:predicted metal-dependent phosphotriesterase family hydrolase
VQPLLSNLAPSAPRSDRADAVTGPTLVDEHLVLAPQGAWYWAQAGIEGQRAHIQTVLEGLARAGIQSIVDTTTIEVGRDPKLSAEVAKATGVDVLLSTGLSSEAAGVSAAFRALDPIRLADIYIAELTGSIPGTNLRAAAIVVEAGAVQSSFDETAALAAAFAHAETGAPVLARADPERLVPLIRSLTSRGVEPASILALGLDRASLSWGTLDLLGQSGVQLGFTSLGDGGGLADDARAALVMYAFNHFGPKRVCLGTGEPIVRRESADEAQLGHPEEALERFRARLAALGAGQVVDESMRVGVRSLWEAPERGDG